MIYKLLVKQHNKTNLKYLCKTEKQDHITYTGSGKNWGIHLRENGSDLTTKLIFETESAEEFRKVALFYSELWNVVKSKDWANIIPEQGEGGDTVSSKQWITDGTVERYIEKKDEIPIGWNKGRSDSCKFKDTNFQSQMSLRVNRISEEFKKSRLAAAQKMLLTRDHSKCGKSGDNNPAKREDVRDKISKSRIHFYQNRGLQYCTECKKHYKDLSIHERRSKKHRCQTS